MADYSKTIWSTGDLITAALMNKAETQYDTAKAELQGGNWAVPAGAIGSGTFPVARIPETVKELFLDAGSGTPQLTNGCAGHLQQETSGNQVNYISLDFDHEVNEFAQWRVRMPQGYDGGTFTAIFLWTAASGSGNVRWGIQARMLGDGDSLDSAWGTAVEVTDTLIAAGAIHFSPVSAAMTPAGTLSGGRYIIFRVYRDAADTGSDTLPADAKLLGVSLKYTTAYTDA
jgi:hypothetical protein